MYISSFHIDGFGLFANVEVENLSPGINIFLGNNEAGKSTCLDFLRAMLTGYPEKRPRLPRNYEPPAGISPGGCLRVNFLSQEGTWDQISILRKPGHKPPQILANDGRKLPVDILNVLLGGINGEVYRKVFGFSLGELEQFESLTGAGVRNALYGASFGSGIVSPAVALAAIADKKGEIFKVRATKPGLNAALAQMETVASSIARQSGHCEEYDNKCKSLAESMANLENARRERKELEKEKRSLEKRLGFWQQWDQWRNQKALLENLPEILGVIPENAVEIISRLQGARENGESGVAGITEKIDLLRKQLADRQVDAALVGYLPQLRQLSEHKQSYRKALSQIPVQKAECVRLRTALEQDLTKLGPDWSCERIRSTNRSIFNRDNLEKQAEELTESNLFHVSAAASLQKANDEVKLAEAAVANAKVVLDNLPEPVADFDGPKRDELRRNMGRLDDCRRQEPGRKRAVNAAKDAFVRAITIANIKIPANAGDEAEWNESARSVLDNLLGHQAEAIAMASELQKHIADSEQAASRLVQAEGKADGLRRQMESLRASTFEGEGPGRSELDARTRALRTLRSVAASLDSDRERLKEIDARIESEVPPAKVGNWFFLILGIIFMLAGAADFAAIWIWGITQFEIASKVVPLNLVEGYGALILGLIFLAGGKPANSQEMKRHKRQIEQLKINRETCQKRLDEHRAQVERLCSEAGVDTTDPIALDATEALIEREKEKCFNEERARKEMERLLNEFNAAREFVQECQKNCQQTERLVQQCRKAWHELMLELRMGGAPTPESASTVFARAEAAQLAYGNFKTACDEMDSLWEDLHEIEDKIVNMPAIAKKLADAEEPLSMEEAVNQLLEECREADMAREKRIHAKANLDNCEADLAKAMDRQTEAAAQLEEASAKLSRVRQAWAAMLRESGLGMELDPQAMREAYICMDNCLGAEKSLNEVSLALAQNEKESNDFIGPLEAMLKQLGREIIKDASGNADWSAVLERLLGDAEDNYALKKAHEHLQTQIDAEEISLGAEKAALQSITDQMDKLLAEAGASTPNDFLILARQKEERGEIQRAIKNLESTLSLAADQEPLNDFLESFKAGEYEPNKERLKEIQLKLEEIGRIEEELTSGIGSLNTLIDALSHDEELASLRQEQSMLQANIESMALSWCSYALAEAILKKAKNIFERERQPEVIKVASDIFRQITNGRWRAISATLDDDKHIDIIPEFGEPVAPEYLSRGTQEQAYLALRLAYIRNHAENATSLPVIMDEILVNFDPERAARTARAFARLSSSTGKLSQQILYFTCHPHMVDILRKAAPSAPLFLVENGGIHTA